MGQQIYRGCTIFILHIKLVNPKGNQPWRFTGRTNAEAEVPILWPPDVKGQLIGKDPDAGKDLRGGGEGGDRGWDVGWHHRLDGRVWANSGRQWRTGKPGVLQSTGSQRVGHDWVPEQQRQTLIGGPDIWERITEIQSRILQTSFPFTRLPRWSARTCPLLVNSVLWPLSEFALSSPKSTKWPKAP